MQKYLITGTSGQNAELTKIKNGSSEVQIKPLSRSGIKKASRALS